MLSGELGRLTEVCGRFNGELGRFSGELGKLTERLLVGRLKDGCPNDVLCWGTWDESPGASK